MAIRVALEHRTSYQYSRPITLGPQVVRLRPGVHTRTPVHRYAMHVSPGNHFCNWQQDAYGNHLARLVFPEKTDHFDVRIDLVVDMVVFNPFDFFMEERVEEWPFTYDRQVKKELGPFLAKGRSGPLFQDFLDTVDRSKRRTIDMLIDCNRLVQERVAYTIRMKPGVQSPQQTLKLGSGSCRDSSWLLVQLLRNLGVAARFVSGYLIQLTPDKEAVDGPSGAAEDFCDLHAWCEAYVPGAGWIGLDPTSGLLAGEGHIPLACAPDPVSAAPITGGHERTKVTFDHAMGVSRVIDAGRAGRPYEDRDWAAIDGVGEQVDVGLKQHDVRLTMGGEPTFVSSRDPDGAEWNTDALGPTKAGLADDLLRRLVGHWAEGALLHHGQGKWYPGEPLPRWAYSAFWRADGQALWENPGLFADPQEPGDAGPEQARRLLGAIGEELGLRSGEGEEGADVGFPAFEDPFYHAWRERRLPANIDPALDPDSIDLFALNDPGKRRELAVIFEGFLGDAVGHVLPLEFLDGHWTTGEWHQRDQRCYLVPGDSPVGFRLPLESQLWRAPDERRPNLPPDPSIPRADAEPLPPRQPQRVWPARSLNPEPPTDDSPESDIVRTALCVEPRDGILRVFLPPVQKAGAFVDLIAAVERATARCGARVLIEGYGAPYHPTLMRMAVTPDPGVIEVNVPPVRTWRDQRSQIETLFDECHQLHLTADKFDVDGRHTGTGGGCHVVAGGADPQDSPWLRRPDLLASLLTYWVNHPSLTYVFSGTFVGATSQAPRVDEARQETIPELELALEQLQPDVTGQLPPPWLVDRVLRNLLIDVTGNTHRTEICIDKLFSPGPASGRLGLVEFRSFEMPPHAQMMAAQNLLIRALILDFWRRPRRQPLARWGNALQDRWLLPRFLELDLHEVCEDLRRGGIPMEAEWFTPHSDFRMPRLGHFGRDGVEVEIRSAIEPWHVLGEEAMAGGQTRHVDSSCERIQVLVRGATDRRHSICVNGYRLPLTPSGTTGELVAGVRYRAWQPPLCLHPTIGIDSPLHIDLYDEWNDRAIAGGTYHVVHPGGRSFDTRPINANEAEGRRSLRFQARDHTAGTYRPRSAPVVPEYPTTLDLRRCAKLPDRKPGK